MLNKVFFWFLTILLSVVCLCQSSFTWVSKSLEKKSEKEALIQIRLNELREKVRKTNGIVQSNIQKEGSNSRLYIQLPGVQDTIVEKLQSKANLQFFETYQLEELSSQLDEANAISLKSTEKGLLDYFIKGRLGMIAYVNTENREKVNKILARKDVMAVFPKNLKFMWSANPEKFVFNSNELVYSLFAVKIPDDEKAYIEGKDIKVASTSIEPSSGEVIIDLTMTVEGVDKWAKMTTQNTGKFIVICLDDVVYSAPKVYEPITGGNTRISGNFSIQEAQNFVNSINQGVLSTPSIKKD